MGWLRDFPPSITIRLNRYRGALRPGAPAMNVERSAPAVAMAGCVGLYAGGGEIWETGRDALLRNFPPFITNRISRYYVALRRGVPAMNVERSAPAMIKLVYVGFHVGGLEIWKTGRDALLRHFPPFTPFATIYVTESFAHSFCYEYRAISSGGNHGGVRGSPCWRRRNMRDWERHFVRYGSAHKFSKFVAGF